VYKNLATGYQNTPKCVIMEQAVRTFDNVTFDLHEQALNCQVLIAMDCSPAEKFAIYATELDREANTKKITVLTGGQQIVMLPPQQQDVMQIEVDGKVHELTADKPVTFNKANDIVRIYLRKTKSDAVNPIAVLENPDDELQVLFDGKNVKVMLGNGEYKGKTCGICGNNDDETDDEFEGPGQCIFERAEDFIQAYQMAGDHCQKAPRPALGKVRCPKRDNRRQADERKQIRHEVTKQIRTNPTGATVVEHQTIEVPAKAMSRQNSIESNESRMQSRSPCQKLRTEYVIEADQVCFTTKPLNVCQSGCRALSQRQAVVEFHCLPKNSPFTKQLQQEADHAILKQLANKRVDFRRTLAVAERCSA
jgi:hypothetical protein